MSNNPSITPVNSVANDATDQSGKKFDVVAFNKDFELIAKTQKEANKIKEAEKLQLLNQDIKEKTIMNMSINELLIDWKVSIDGILNDIQQRNISRTTLTRGNRLFHLGMTILLGVLFFYLMYTVISRGSNTSRVIKEYHTHLQLVNE